MDDDTAAAVSGVQVDKLFHHFAQGQSEQIGTTTKVKLADSGMNCERLGRHIPGFFKDKVDVEGIHLPRICSLHFFARHHPITAPGQFAFWVASQAAFA